METYEAGKVQTLMMFFGTQDIDVAIKRCSELCEALERLSALCPTLEEEED